MRRPKEPPSLTKRIIFGLAAFATAAGITCSHLACGPTVILPTGGAQDPGANTNTNVIGIGIGYNPFTATPTPSPVASASPSPSPTVTP